MEITMSKTKQVGGRLKTGNARIVTMMSDGVSYPDGRRYYVIEDLLDQATYHVDADVRPTWVKYLPVIGPTARIDAAISLAYTGCNTK